MKHKAARDMYRLDAQHVFLRAEEPAGGILEVTVLSLGVISFNFFYGITFRKYQKYYSIKGLRKLQVMGYDLLQDLALGDRNGHPKP